MCSRVIVLPVLQELEELLGSPLLEKTHQGRLDCFHFSGGDLWDPPISVDKTPRDLLELEVSGDLRVDQDLGEFARSEDELWYQINVVVPVLAELCGYGLFRAEFTVELGGAITKDCGYWSMRLADTRRIRPYLGKVEGCTVTTIVIVPVHVEDLLAVDG
jgi:hypothetical protein